MVAKELRSNFRQINVPRKGQKTTNSDDLYLKAIHNSLVVSIFSDKNSLIYLICRKVSLLMHPTKNQGHHCLLCSC